MVMDKKLKKIIFSKLYNDLSGVEIIQHNNSIWFIDRSKKYWYLEYIKYGTLYWRYPFFNNFFNLFSMEMNEYEQVIVDWVEEVLNSKVVTPYRCANRYNRVVEEVLNSKVVTPNNLEDAYVESVEEVLNSKVVTPVYLNTSPSQEVEKVLNSKVVTLTPASRFVNMVGKVEKVLNSKVVTPATITTPNSLAVEEVLNCKVVTPASNSSPWVPEVEEVLKGNVVM